METFHSNLLDIFKFCLPQLNALASTPPVQIDEESRQSPRNEMHEQREHNGAIWMAWNELVWQKGGDEKGPPQSLCGLKVAGRGSICQAEWKPSNQSNSNQTWPLTCTRVPPQKTKCSSFFSIHYHEIRKRLQITNSEGPVRVEFHSMKLTENIKGSANGQGQYSISKTGFKARASWKQIRPSHPYAPDYIKPLG